MKKILLLMLCLVLVGCKSESDFNKDFPYMKDIPHRYEKVDFDEAYEILTSKTGIVILAFNSNLYDCPYCKVVMPLLNEVVYDEVDVVYYLDIYNMRMKDTKEYQKLFIYLDEQVELLVRNDKKTLVVPDVYFVRDGVIVAHHIATLEDEEGKFKSNLTSEEKIELKNIYQEYLEEWKHD